MKNMTDSEFINLKNIFLVSNVPEYLYYHFRAAPSVQQFAKDIAVQEIIEGLNEKAIESSAAEAVDIDSIISQYLLVTALTFKDTKEAIDAFKKLDLSYLDWGEELKNIYFSTQEDLSEVRSSKIISFDSKNKISIKPPSTKPKETNINLFI